MGCSTNKATDTTSQTTPKQANQTQSLTQLPLNDEQHNVSMLSHNINNNNNEIDYEDRVYALFSSAMITHDNVNVEFKLVNVDPREIEFEMTITPKN